jgi:hypothetical protein
MNASQLERERAEFEAWARGEGYDVTTYPDGSFVIEETARQFEGWQARAQQASAPDGVCWDLLPAWLIDHCEGDVLTEELLQRAVAGMLASDAYQALARERRRFASPPPTVPADVMADVGHWQPIETAPKDGTTVILGRDMGDFGFARGYGYFEGGDGSFVSGWISNGFSEYPGNLGLAHPALWMPLPPPPAARAAEKGTG